jgi:hypothetical protein
MTTKKKKRMKGVTDRLRKAEECILWVANYLFHPSV